MCAPRLQLRLFVEHRGCHGGRQQYDKKLGCSCRKLCSSGALAGALASAALNCAALHCARWRSRKRAAAAIRQMRAWQRAEPHKCACCKRAAASLAHFSLWPSPWQAMRRRSGLPSLKSSRISGGACASIVFRAAAAKNAQLHHEADSVVHSRLAIRAFHRKMLCIIFYCCTW